MERNTHSKLRIQIVLKAKQRKLMTCMSFPRTGFLGTFFLNCAFFSKENMLLFHFLLESRKDQHLKGETHVEIASMMAIS